MADDACISTACGPGDFVPASTPVPVPQQQPLPLVGEKQGASWWQFQQRLPCGLHQQFEEEQLLQQERTLTVAAAAAATVAQWWL
jgi:hypothetical protein